MKILFCLQYGRYIRTMMRKDKGLAVVAELLGHSNDRVIRAMSGALRNLAIDPVNRELLGEPFIKKQNGVLYQDFAFFNVCSVCCQVKTQYLRL